MKLFYTLLLVFASVAAFTQGRYDVRVTQQSFDCVANKAVLCVAIKATSADSAFVMGNANFRLGYLKNQLTNPKFKSKDNFSDDANYDIMDSTLAVSNTSDSSIFTINVKYLGRRGAGTTVGVDWMTVACIEFDIPVSNSTKCYSVNLLKQNPPTVVTRVNATSLTFEVSQGAFTSIANQCPVLPVASITGGGVVITPPQSASLTVSSTFPASVVITGGITIDLVAGTLSKSFRSPPNLTTTFSILQVTGACGTGTANAAQKDALITVQQVENCNPKCVILTAVKVK